MRNNECSPVYQPAPALVQIAKARSRVNQSLCTPGFQPQRFHKGDANVESKELIYSADKRKRKFVNRKQTPFAGLFGKVNHNLQI